MHVWAAVKKYHMRTGVGMEPTTSWLLDRRHTTRPPRLPDGYGWFDSHNSSGYCILGWVDLIILNNFALSQHKHRMFSACLSRCEKYHRWTRVGIEPTTSWLLDRRHTTRPPRLPDGYGWFDSHNSSRYCVGLSINDFRLGGFDYIE